MAAVTVSPKFQVVIPREVRERAGIGVGDRIEVMWVEGRVELVPVREAAALRGLVSGTRNRFRREGLRP